MRRVSSEDLQFQPPNGMGWQREPRGPVRTTVDRGDGTETDGMMAIEMAVMPLLLPAEVRCCCALEHCEASADGECCRIRPCRRMDGTLEAHCGCARAGCAVASGQRKDVKESALEKTLLRSDLDRERETTWNAVDDIVFARINYLDSRYGRYLGTPYSRYVSRVGRTTCLRKEGVSSHRRRCLGTSPARATAKLRIWCN